MVFGVLFWKILPVFVFFSVTCKASNVDVAEEVSEFASSNGFKPVNVVLLQDESSTDLTRQIVKSLGKRNIQAKVLKVTEMVLTPYHIEKEDFIFAELRTEEDWLSILPIISHIQIQSSLIAGSWKFTNISSGGLNAQAFLLQTPSLSWFDVMCLNETTHALVRKLELTKACSQSKSLRPDLNLHNITITSVDLPWEPYVTMDNCDHPNLVCEPSGIGIEIAREMASVLRLNIDYRKESSGKWGTVPVGGGIRSKNSTWAGLTGKIVYGQNHMTTVFWYMRASHHDILDMTSVYTVMQDTVLSPRPPTLDFGLFVRPFTADVWKAIFLLICLLSLCIITSLYINKRDTRSWSFRVACISAMLFWVLLNAFYSGALTMFFSLDVGPLFGSMEEVIEGYPQWKLKVIKGTEMSYEIPASQSTIYARFWERMASKPEETFVNSVQEGLQKVISEPAVIRLSRDTFLYFVNHYFEERDKFRVEFRYHSSFALAYNSPLSPAFQHCLLHMNQYGITHRLRHKWEGTRVINWERGNHGTMVVTAGQMVLVFAIIAGAILVSLLCLLLELFINRAILKEKKLAKRRPKRMATN